MHSSSDTDAYLPTGNDATIGMTNLCAFVVAHRFQTDERSSATDVNEYQGCVRRRGHPDQRKGRSRWLFARRNIHRLTRRRLSNFIRAQIVYISSNYPREYTGYIHAID